MNNKANAMYLLFTCQKEQFKRDSCRKFAKKVELGYSCTRKTKIYVIVKEKLLNEQVVGEGHAIHFKGCKNKDQF